jgi:uncharacterized protein (TIGR00159 family)
MNFFRLQIETIQSLLDWRVTLDILLISMAIFFLYRFFRSTGSWKIVLGVVGSGLFFIFARFLNLKGIIWIYSFLSPIILISLVILFQPELRKIFERLVSIKGKETGTELAQLASTISDSVFQLAKKRQGGILVLTGKDSIQSLVSGGITLDAQPSFSLIMSLFDPSSPGHDGAIIISNAKCVSFGNRLPLSNSNKLSEDFGTRHHAGLGLAENTDAFVIVISEERGSITIFQDGSIIPIQEKNDLIHQIQKYWTIKPWIGNKSSDKKKKSRTWTELALSFVAAFLFWSTVVLTQDATREITLKIPVNYDVSGENIHLVQMSASTVKIRLKGSTENLKALDLNTLHFSIPYLFKQPGEYQVFLNKQYLSLPTDIILLSVKPSTIEIVLN